VSERDQVLDDLRERARFYASLTGIGVPRAAVRPAEDARPTLFGTEAHAGERGAGASRPRPEAPVELPVEFAAPADAAPAERLAAVRSWVGDCRRCALAGGRKTIVFGQGHPEAALMFVGEAPGADEDEQGLAFVGRAGQLLTDIIEKGLRFKRSDVFIANVIKCRPPKNRNPEPDEILACQPFLEAQIDAIRPKVLVGLGKFGAQWLLRTAEPISRLRGRCGQYKGIHVMPTYHPAYLLRNPSAKKDVWEDMKVVLRLLAE
jgi:uracil-DNA glycosylase family 4